MNSKYLKDSFKRNNYFYGKLMTSRDFKNEQSYFNIKRQLINNLVLGEGVAAGLETYSEDGKVFVSPGVAIDYLGREIVVKNKVEVDLEAAINEADSIFKKMEKDYMSVDMDDGSVYEFFLCIDYDECQKEKTISVTEKDPCCEDESKYNYIKEKFKFLLFEDGIFRFVNSFSDDDEVLEINDKNDDEENEYLNCHDHHWHRHHKRRHRHNFPIHRFVRDYISDKGLDFSDDEIPRYITLAHLRLKYVNGVLELHKHRGERHRRSILRFPFNQFVYGNDLLFELLEILNEVKDGHRQHRHDHVNNDVKTSVITFNVDSELKAGDRLVSDWIDTKLGSGAIWVDLGLIKQETGKIEKDSDEYELSSSIDESNGHIQISYIAKKEKGMINTLTVRWWAFNAKEIQEVQAKKFYISPKRGCIKEGEELQLAAYYDGKQLNGEEVDWRVFEVKEDGSLTYTQKVKVVNGLFVSADGQGEFRIDCKYKKDSELKDSVNVDVVKK